MQFDWSTFALEIINLLVLVWLLKRFLYQPVLNLVARRRDEIRQQLEEASQRQEQAETLRQQFEQRLSDWEEEKSKARDELNHALEQEREKRLQALEEELSRQGQKYELQQQQLQAEWRSDAEDEALKLAAAFSSRLLSELSGPELNQRLLQLFLRQFAELPDSTVERWRESWDDQKLRVDISSAIALNSSEKQQVRDALQRRLDLQNIDCHFSQDEKLIAGLRVAMGSWLLRANVRDELRFFAEASHE